MKINWLPIAMLAVLALSLLSGINRAPVEQVSEIPYSSFLAEVESGQVRAVVIQDSTVRGERTDATLFTTFAPNDPGLVADLLESGVEINAQPPTEPGFLGRLLSSLLPFILLIGFWIWFSRRQGLGGQGGVFGFGKSRARRTQGEDVNVTLDDVAGIDEAKEEVGEMVNFLKDPERFTRVGGKIPRGASRVRDLFEQAKKSAPCIIFIDEIDAVGRKRGAGLGGGHDEREQTLNAMLVEMDGFEGNDGIIVVAATNRPDVLDPALLRPGRFDRQVVVPLPDVKGRSDILMVHMRKVPAEDSVDSHVIARGTPGFSGADLANLVNEAALFAARSDRRTVSMEDFEQAKDKILMGAERRSLVMSEEEKLLTAYHEAGHTIVGRLVPEHDPVHKVTIIPRGRALGVTMFLPERDRLSASKRRLESEIAVLFGGRLAEEIIFGDESVTTGAQNDIERATQIARNMVTKWGLSEEMGPLTYAEDEGEVFLGQAVTSRKNMSDETARRVDGEIRALVDRNYQRAKDILMSKIDVLHAMAEALVEFETLDSDQIDAVMAGAKPTNGGRDGGKDTGGEAGSGPAPKPRSPAPAPPAVRPQHARQSLAG